MNTDKPKITAFFEGGGLHQDREEKLISLWKTAWAKVGWEPRIMRLSDCILDSRTSDLLKKISDFPCLADPFYQRMTFLRWIAFAREGGVLADYDVFPRVKFPRMPDTLNLNGHLNLQMGFVSVTKEWCDRFLKAILEYTPSDSDLFRGQMHITDQEVMQHTPGLFDQVEDLCRVFGDDGWQQCPLVHFTNESLRFRHQSVSYILGMKHE